MSTICIYCFTWHKGISYTPSVCFCVTHQLSTCCQIHFFVLLLDLPQSSIWYNHSSSNAFSSFFLRHRIFLFSSWFFPTHLLFCSLPDLNKWNALWKDIPSSFLIRTFAFGIPSSWNSLPSDVHFHTDLNHHFLGEPPDHHI